jgi:hypothetical protein
MKYLMKYWVFLGVLISSPSPNFNLKEQPNFEEKVILKTGYWLSQTPIINPNSKAKIYFQNSYSVMTGVKDNAFYPKINFSIQLSKNLVLSSKVFSFQSYDDTPQILGAGLQYFFGASGDTLNNLLIIQRTDIKGLEHFHLSSINLELKKWVQANNFHFRYGIGSMFLKNLFYPVLEDLKGRSEKQLNYFEFEFLYKNYLIDIGLGIKLSNEINLITINFCKELF